MLSCRFLLLVLVWACAGVMLSEGLPAREKREIANRRFRARPSGSELLIDAQIGNVLRNTPSGATLIASQPSLPALEDRLIDNATLIRPNLVDTFRCEGKVYGYYADVENDCQVFHVCLPLRQLYPANFTTDVTYQFSFICPEYTIFTQDAMVCAWETEAVPCEYAQELYWMNQNFFREVEDNFGTRYAHVNEPLP